MVRFRTLIEGKSVPFLMIVRDPLGNSFIGSSEHENPSDDPNIEVRVRVQESRELAGEKDE